MRDHNGKECFIISPIGEPNSEIRKRSDQVLKFIITPVATSLGYRPLRADQISEPGIITKQVIQYIVESPLVIADLTDRNPNVFYELAIRHAIKKPVIQMIRKDNPIPFDVAVTRMIQFDLDVESVDNAKRELEGQMRSIENDAFVMDNPISFSLNLKTLEQSDNPEQRSIASIISSINELKTAIKEQQTVVREQQIPAGQRDDKTYDAVIAVSRLATAFARKTIEQQHKLIAIADMLYGLIPEEGKKILETKLNVGKLTRDAMVAESQLHLLMPFIPPEGQADTMVDLPR
jgi:hypothetical protein